ncbi:ABC transporter permease [Flavobacterium sp. '19STA2R22 D10 B1']|uniref:ABC transporter permease n=1 Tax=Flavobacterium aerium TaxID=3037261 RepID=UPI00278BF601|nr:ABC transporter permease [Flavobacterium sp. '19STA2R22 D10 B1']
MLRNWIKIFLYQLKRNKLFAALNILGLSLGIAGLIFTTLYWNEEHSYDAWNPEKDKIFQVISDMGEGKYWSTVPGTLGEHLGAEFTEVESFCYFKTNYQSEIIEYNGKKELYKKILNAQKNFFEFFPFEFIKGDKKTALQDNASIALSEGNAKLLFGDEDPMGKTVLYQNTPLVVRGVYKIKGKSSIEPLIVISTINKELEQNKDQWGNYNFGLYVKLKDPSQAKTVESKIGDLFYEYKFKKEAKSLGVTPEELIKKWGQSKTVLENLKDSRLHSTVKYVFEEKGNYQFLLILFGLSILVLTLSIINYVNLATADAVKRAKEVGVRKILGASKSNIVKQFIFETIILTTFSILLALVIVELSLPYYNDFLGKELVIQGSQFYLQLISIFVIVILFAGIFPAVYVADFEALKVLKGNFGRSKSGIWFRNGMLILQFAIATFFIIGSYIVHQQIHYLSTKDLGFKGDQIIQIDYRNPISVENKDYKNASLQKYHTVIQELKKIKGVKNASTGSFRLGSGANSSSGFTYKDNAVQGQNMGIDFGMLDMMEIKIVSGRNLSEKFASDTINSILINETAAKLMNEKDPIGKEIEWNGNKLKIVGVVKDFNLYAPQDKIPPMVFFHFKTINWMVNTLSKVFVKVSPNDMEQTISDIEKYWGKNVDVKYPFNYDFVNNDFARTYENYVKQERLFSLLNFIVILIALFGLFALASYSIERRMKEIAIRKTLGAETKTLLKELSKQYIVYCIIGFLIALIPVYYLLGKWLENFAYRIDISVIPFIIGFVVLLLLTLLIVLSKAYQATKVDVLRYLKYE